MVVFNRCDLPSLLFHIVGEPSRFGTIVEQTAFGTERAFLHDACLVWEHGFAHTEVKPVCQSFRFVAQFEPVLEPVVAGHALLIGGIVGENKSAGCTAQQQELLLTDGEVSAI